MPRIDWASLNPDERERLRQQAIAENRRASAPILAELAQAGFVVDWIADLFNKKLNYQRAIPILLKWLPQAGTYDVKEDIVRALSVRWAKPVAARALVEEFRRAPDYEDSFKWAIGNALEVVADDSVAQDIIDLATDERHGTSRQMLAMALGKLKAPRAAEAAVQLLDDDQVCGHALTAVRKLKASQARPAVERLLQHPKTWIRRQAKSTLFVFDRMK